MQATTRHASAWLAVVALVGCHKDEPKKTEAPVAASSSSSTPPVVASAPVPAASSAAPAPSPSSVPLVIAPAVPALEKQSSMDHVDLVGWSADGATFGYCKHSGGLGGNTCVLYPHEGKPETFGDFDEKKSEIDPALHAKLEARKKAIGFATPPQRWAFADLELTWDAPSGSTVRVGARVKGEAPGFGVVLRDGNPGAEEGSSHVELIALSADGLWLGAVAHSFHGEYSDTFTVKVSPVARVAVIAYNNAGLEHHKKKQYKESAALFEKAVAADPSYELAAYNLACAYARLGDPRAEKALGDAFARAGNGAAALKKRALADDDFGAVKTAPWFVTVTKP